MRGGVVEGGKTRVLGVVPAVRRSAALLARGLRTTPNEKAPALARAFRKFCLTISTIVLSTHDYTA
jgi:hypothetical protein